MITTVILPLCLFVFGTAFAEKQCPTNFCNSTSVADGLVNNFCLKEVAQNMTDRCCIINETVIGLDLRFCEIKKLNVSGMNVSSIIIMDLQHNDLDSLSPHDLIGFVTLHFLYLPGDIPCPGGNTTWENISSDPNMTSCCSPFDPCLNISCTVNGQCISTGPGSAKCICKPGHYGYKCMNEGEFPAVLFSTSLTISTVVLCAVLWFAQGRDPYKKRQYTITSD